jgi:peptidyl-prolyl cis-trans isomerase C
MKFFILAMVGLLSASCTREAPPIQNTVVARVGSDSLNAKDFAGLIMARAKYLDAVVVKDPATVNRIKSDILREFVVHSFLKAWAKEKNVTPTESEISAEVIRMEKNYPNNNAFQAALSHEGLTYDRWREKVRLSIIEKKLFQELRSSYSAPTESELQTYYDHNKDKFKKSKAVKVRQIVIDTEEGAKEVQKELKKGKSFEKLAERFSISPEGKSGGLTDWIDTETLEVYNDAYNLKPGTYSNLLKSPYGFHIIQLIDKRPGGVQSFKDAKDIIRKNLLENKEQAAYSQWLEEQIRKNKVFKNEPLIGSIKVSTEDR